jgi:AraC-like DNA-binding protein
MADVWVWRVAAVPGLELLRAQFSTVTGFQREVHESLSIGVLERGGELYEHRHGRDAAAAGDITFVNAMEPHASKSATPEGFAYRAFQPDPGLFSALMLEVTDRDALPAFRAPVVHDPDLAARLVALHYDLEAGTDDLETGVRVRGLLWTLLERYGDARLEAVTRGSGGVRLAVEYLDAHLAERVTLEQLAALSGASPFHFARAFAATVGVPPHVYLTNRRVERAKALLRAGYPPATVALEVGFFDQSHLNRAFRRFVGVPSGAYQQAARSS